MKHRRIVTLCGSTRFRDAFEKANAKLTLEGDVVLSVGFFCHNEDPITPQQKLDLDELHKDKISLSTTIYVLNVDGYIGESTRSEIDYARAHGVPVLYLEDPAPPAHFNDAVYAAFAGMPDGGDASEILHQVRLRWPGSWELCTVIDVADAMQAKYGS